MAVAVDSNVVIGFLDRGDAFHAAADAKIRVLLSERELLYASGVTYAEVLTGAKLGHHDESVVRGFFDQLITRILPVEVDVAERAAELRGQKKSLRMPDALILAGAEVSMDVDRIVCADSVALDLAGALRCRVDPLRPG